MPLDLWAQLRAAALLHQLAGVPMEIPGQAVAEQPEKPSLGDVVAARALLARHSIITDLPEG